MSATETTQQAKKVIKISKIPFNIKKSDIDGFKFAIPIKKAFIHSGFKEDVIYKASENDFLQGKYPNLVVINKLNVIKCSSRTVATYTNGRNIELTSDAITKLIGQKNYDTLFTALCSIINPQLRIEGILSLLTENKYMSVETQTALSHSAEIIKQRNTRTKVKRKRLTFYPVKDEMLKEIQTKKVVIDPETVSLIEPEDIKVEAQTKSLPELENLDEDSNLSNLSFGNMSIGSNFSIGSIIDLLTDPKSTLDTVDRHTNIQNTHTNVTMLDGTTVTIKGNPDIFHLASTEILEELSFTDRKKIMCHQAYIDWKFCLQRDVDGNLPFHQAVMNDDVDLLKRHCAMLKSKNVSVDIPGEENKTALQISLQHNRPKCTTILLQNGADPLIHDDESRNSLHLAAEVSSENMEAVLAYCKSNAREILRDGHTWSPQMEDKNDEKLSSILLNELCSTYDNSGYTPLMIASKNAKYENVSLLIEAAPTSVNMKNPASGDTALYLATAAACIQCRDSTDHTKVSPDLMKTIEILMKNGADPSIYNSSGNSINTLLTEFYIKDLSMLIVNEISSLKYFDGKQNKNASDYIIVRNENGDEKIEKITKKKPFISDNNNKIKVKSVQILNSGNIPPQNFILEGGSKNVKIIDNKLIKLNINKSNLIPIIRTQNIKRTYSNNGSEDIKNKKAKS